MNKYLDKNFLIVKFRIQSLQYDNPLTFIIMLFIIVIFQESFHTNLAECMSDQPSSIQSAEELAYCTLSPADVEAAKREVVITEMEE